MLNPLLKIKHTLVFIWMAALTVALSFCLSSCNDESDAPDVSGVKVEINTRRLDKDLYSLDTNNIGQGLQQLSTKYPDFLDFYLDTLLGFGIHGRYEDTASGIRYGLKSFLSHKDYRGLYDTITAHFPDTKEIEEELERGFKYVKHYYPEYNVPKIVYVTSGLNNYGAFTYGDHVLGIGLDMFLGSGYPYYRSVGIPDYMGNKLNPEYIPVAVMRAVYQNKYPFRPEGSTLLDMMIQKGKEMYFVKKVLPFLPDHLLLGYTEEQLEWCRQNEAMVFNFFASQNLLYEKEWQKILRYVTDGPTSAGMPGKSPGNIGSWVGLQIVEAYAAQNPGMSLKELMAVQQDAQAFLQKSKYKPR